MGLHSLRNKITFLFTDLYRKVVDFTQIHVSLIILRIKLDAYTKAHNGILCEGACFAESKKSACF